MDTAIPACAHCGYRNEDDARYCLNCGARLIPDPEPETGLPELQAETLWSEPEHPDPSSPAAPEPEIDGAEPASFTPYLTEHLPGLMPEHAELRKDSYFGQDDTEGMELSAQTLNDMRSWFSQDPVLPVYTETGRPRTMAVRQQYLLFVLIGLAACMPFWLPSTVPPSRPYRWDGTQDAWQIIQNLEPGSRVLVLWQNEPSVAGELDLPLSAVLHHLLTVPADLHLLSQHPLGLLQARLLLQAVAADILALSQTAIPLDGAEALVHEIGYWPGGYAVLPGLAPWTEAQPPDLHLIVTANAADVLHWLELVVPGTDAPAVAITTAGTGQVVRPYLDSGQLAGLVTGYEGAHYYTGLLQDAGTPVAAPELARHAAAQNWITACLVTMILVTILFRDPPALPWTSRHLES